MTADQIREAEKWFGKYRGGSSRWEANESISEYRFQDPVTRATTVITRRVYAPEENR